jgi:hypothetical protein
MIYKAFQGNYNLKTSLFRVGMKRKTFKFPFRLRLWDVPDDPARGAGVR